MTAWAYDLDLHFAGSVEADTREEAELAALDDAREALDAHPERWAVADLAVVELAVREEVPQ